MKKLDKLKKSWSGLKPWQKGGVIGLVLFSFLHIFNFILPLIYQYITKKPVVEPNKAMGLFFFLILPYIIFPAAYFSLVGLFWEMLRIKKQQGWKIVIVKLFVLFILSLVSLVIFYIIFAQITYILGSIAIGGS